ncbi:uncharacterized protein LOC112150194 [Oryzias melastigma]|uniref:uncharacterized protein LOC112150194 n=1 Tax=Oryzias melastigma TaxID=30732 RepID=UPI000CF80690|nr:uncharacterized protein LOC112150194 [Oryzias melastigma]
MSKINVKISFKLIMIPNNFIPSLKRRFSRCGKDMDRNQRPPSPMNYRIQMEKARFEQWRLKKQKLLELQGHCRNEDLPEQVDVVDLKLRRQTEDRQKRQEIAYKHLEEVYKKEKEEKALKHQQLLQRQKAERIALEQKKLQKLKASQVAQVCNEQAIDTTKREKRCEESAPETVYSQTEEAAFESDTHGHLEVFEDEEVTTEQRKRTVAFDLALASQKLIEAEKFRAEATISKKKPISQMLEKKILIEKQIELLKIMGMDDLEMFEELRNTGGFRLDDIILLCRHIICHKPLLGYTTLEEMLTKRSRERVTSKPTPAAKKMVPPTPDRATRTKRDTSHYGSTKICPPTNDSRRMDNTSAQVSEERFEPKYPHPPTPKDPKDIKVSAAKKKMLPPTAVQVSREEKIQHCTPVVDWEICHPPFPGKDHYSLDDEHQTSEHNVQDDRHSVVKEDCTSEPNRRASSVMTDYSEDGPEDESNNRCPHPPINKRITSVRVSREENTQPCTPVEDLETCHPAFPGKDHYTLDEELRASVDDIRDEVLDDCFSSVATDISEDEANLRQPHPPPRNLKKLKTCSPKLEQNKVLRRSSTTNYSTVERSKSDLDRKIGSQHQNMKVGLNRPKLEPPSLQCGHDLPKDNLSSALPAKSCLFPAIAEKQGRVDVSKDNRPTQTPARPTSPLMRRQKGTESTPRESAIQLTPSEAEEFLSPLRKPQKTCYIPGQKKKQ